MSSPLYPFILTCGRINCHYSDSDALSMTDGLKP